MNKGISSREHMLYKITGIWLFPFKFSKLWHQWMFIISGKEMSITELTIILILYFLHTVHIPFILDFSAHACMHFRLWNYYPSFSFFNRKGYSQLKLYKHELSTTSRVINDILNSKLKMVPTHNCDIYKQWKVGRFKIKTPRKSNSTVVNAIMSIKYLPMVYII